MNERRYARLSGTTLKWIAAISMLLDHAGLILFPDVGWLRVAGRLAFPLFAFFIAEGFRYTRNRARYLSTIALIALAYQVFYYFFAGSLYMSIFVTFTISICLLYLLEYCKQAFVVGSASAYEKAFRVFLFAVALLGAYALSEIRYKDFAIDYTFWGCVTPLFAGAFHSPRNKKGSWEKVDTLPFSLLAMAIPLLVLSHISELNAIRLFGVPCQFYALLALPLLLFYSGKRGKYPMKYFFYLFYPAHLVLLYGIAYLL